MQTLTEITYLLVGLDINPIKLTESDKVCPHKDTKFLALTLSLLSIPCVTLVLYSYPQLIHLGKVQEHKGYGIFYSSILVLRFSSIIQQKRSPFTFLKITYSKALMPIFVSAHILTSLYTIITISSKQNITRTEGLVA